MVEHIWYVPPAFAKPLSMETKIAFSLVDYRLYVTTNRENNLKIWLIMMFDKEGKLSSWARSELAVAEKGVHGWVRRVSNNEFGYFAAEPDPDSKLLKQEPNWRGLTMEEILKIAFREFTIDRLDHSVLKKLRG